MGWNSLLIELFLGLNYAQMTPEGGAGLNRHFGAETDFFNHQCMNIIKVQTLFILYTKSDYLHDFKEDVSKVSHTGPLAKEISRSRR